MSPSECHVIFLQDRFLLGGIEVLELKVAAALAALGCEITITCREGNEVPTTCDAIKLFKHRGYSELLDRTLQIVKSTRKTIILVTLHPTAAMAALCMAELIQRKPSSKDVRLFQWVSHSRAFFFSGKIVSSLLKNAFFRLPVRSTYFMNEPARDAHATHWKTNLEEYQILRIIGRNPTSINALSTDDKVSVVSVGRLVPFKSYNRHVPAIVAKLRSEGLDITWDILGYGPDEKFIASEIEKLGVSSSVRLLGALDHDSFDETVVKYNLFVGMGTAILEAGKTGTPTIVAAENSGARCYGYIFETPSDSVGDVVTGHKQRLLDDCIRDFSRTGVEERRSIGRACSESSFRRESTIEEFSGAIISSDTAVQCGRFGRIGLYLFRAYLRAKELKEKMATGQ